MVVKTKILQGRHPLTDCRWECMKDFNCNSFNFGDMGSGKAFCQLTSFLKHKYDYSITNQEELIMITGVSW